MQRARWALALPLAALLAAAPLAAQQSSEPVPPPEKPVPGQTTGQATGDQPAGEQSAGDQPLEAQTAPEQPAVPDGAAPDGTVPDGPVPDGAATGQAPAAEPAPAPVPIVPLIVGAAPVAGSFFPTAGAVCREVNRQQAASGLRCLVEESEGSAENLQQLRDGTLDLAIVQSDWAFYAADGTAADHAPPFTNLYALVALQPQVMTLVAGLDSGIEGVATLAGKRLAIGPADSALNRMARNLLQVLGLTEQATLVELPVEQQVAALCAGEIDAFLLPVTHPSGSVEGAVVGCGARLVSLSDDKIAAMIASWPFLVGAELPAGLYPGQGEAVAGYGTVAMLVATDRLSDAAAYAIVKAIFEGLDDLKAQHPTLAGLSADEMAGQAGLTIPLHPGALRYYEEQGWR